ncbi:MAG: WD40 repeat domain-containing protein [Candidatus Eremiobacteraeota bacterium]|nr:WD40 repeat domain-containing protein [Candidatus Eremiobacteraeota bacterium]
MRSKRPQFKLFLFFTLMAFFSAIAALESPCGEAEGAVLAVVRTVRVSQEPLSAIAVSPENSLIAGVDSRNVLTLWDSDGRTRERISFQHPIPPVRTLALSPDGARIALGPEKGFVRVLSTGGNDDGVTLDWYNTVTALAFSPGGKGLLVGSLNGDVKFWDAESGALTRLFNDTDFLVQWLCFSPSGRMAAAGFWDRSIALWDVATGKIVRLLREKEEPLLLYYNPQRNRDEKRSSRSSDTVSLCGAFTGDGLFIAGGCNDGTVRIWNVESGEKTGTLKISESPVTSLSASPRGSYLACGTGSGETCLLDPAGQSAPVLLPGHHDAVCSLAFNSEGTMIVSASREGVVIEWKVQEAK